MNNKAHSRSNARLYMTILLVLLMSVTIPVVSNGNVNAASGLRTKKEAMRWVKKQKGKKIDYDHHAGVQCIDLIKAYYHYIGAKPVSGNASTYTKNKLPKKWKRIKSSKKFVPQAGDIAVWKVDRKSGLRYGHVAIVISANKKNMKCMNQHCDVIQCRIKTHKNYKKKKSFYGVIRPVFKEKKQ